MNTQLLDMQDFADLNDVATIADRVNLGPVMVTIGHSIATGCFVVIQTIADLAITSEIPLEPVRRAGITGALTND